MIAICIDNYGLDILKIGEIYEVAPHGLLNLYYVNIDNRNFALQTNRFRILTNQEIRKFKLDKICQR